MSRKILNHNLFDPIKTQNLSFKIIFITMRENKDKTLENKLILSEGRDVKNIPIHIRRFWSDLQMSYGSQNIAFIDFIPTDPEENYWRWYVEFDSAIAINSNLKHVFLFNPNLGAGWDKTIEKKIKRLGFFIPKGELVRLNIDLLHANIIHQLTIYNHFPFGEYLQNIKKESNKKRFKKVPLPISGIWNHWKLYIQLLRKTVRRDFDTIKLIRKTMQRSVTLSDFDKKLPSQQLTLILYWIVERFYCADFEETFLKKVLSKSPPLVQSFWGNHGNSIISHLNNFLNKNSLEKKYSFFDNPQMQEDFYNTCLTDFEIIVQQEILDDNSGYKILSFFPEEIQEQLQIKKLSLAQRMKKTIGTASILERIQSFTETTFKSPQPNLAPPFDNWMEESDKNWYDLKKQQRQNIASAIENDLIEVDQNTLKEITTIRYEKYLRNLANEITGPFLVWEKEEDQWFPQINLLPQDQSKPLGTKFQKQLEKELAEFAQLEQLLVELQTKNSLVQIRNFSNEIKGFKFARVEAKWNKAYNSHLLAVKNKEHYRIRRMQEFGILEADEELSYRKEIWLNEMLKIEEEVRPFTAFVKQAFKAVLPFSKKIEFDPFRHSIDGVEFDPETIQDHEKWLSGEVMKPFRVQTENERIEQVNAFALDYSGSMTHEKMRNLFKLCYLLVLGLENHKTYDAFHFFSTYFIETANFTNDYTNRTLLFKILRNIATIEKGKVKFKGTGGTNISEGIFECHKRVNEFAEELKKRKSNVTFLKSVFVLTDGEPTAGIIEVDKLAEAINRKREDGNFAIKGIYLKPEDEETYFMESVFGKNQFVETSEFSDAVQQFIYIMTLTYKEQRDEFRKEKKMRRRKRIT